MKTRVAVAERLPGAAFVPGVFFSVRSVHGTLIAPRWYLNERGKLLLGQRSLHESEVDCISGYGIDSGDLVGRQGRLRQELVADADRQVLGNLAVGRIEPDAIGVIVEPVIGLAIGGYEAFDRLAASHERVGIGDVHPDRLVAGRGRVAPACNETDVCCLERVQTEWW